MGYYLVTVTQESCMKKVTLLAFAALFASAAFAGKSYEFGDEENQKNMTDCKQQRSDMVKALRMLRESDEVMKIIYNAPQKSW